MQLLIRKRNLIYKYPLLNNTFLNLYWQTKQNKTDKQDNAGKTRIFADINVHHSLIYRYYIDDDMRLT